MKPNITFNENVFYHNQLIKLTNKCIHNCIYCDCLGKKEKEHLSISEIQKQLNVKKKEGLTKVIFPCNFESHDSFLDILRYAKKKGFFITIESTGNLSSSSLLSDILKYVSSFYFFLNGPDEKIYDKVLHTKDAFNKAIVFIQNVVASGKNIKINVVITSYNYKHLPEIVLLVHRLGVKNIEFIYPIGMDDGNSSFRIFQKIIPSITPVFHYLNKAKRIALENKITINNGIIYHNPYIPIDLDLEYEKVKPSYSYTPYSSSSKDVSIIIPTYNRKSLLKNTLISLFNQNYVKDKYEIVVVDDGSNDETNEMVRSLKATCNITYLYWHRKKPYVFGEPENRTGPARNLGIKYAKGNLIIFLDSDVIVSKNLVAEHIKSHKQNNRCYVLGYCYWLDKDEKIDMNKFAKKDDFENKKPWNLLKYIRPSSTSFLKYLSWSLFITRNISIPRLALESSGLFDDTYIYYATEDIDLGYRLSKLGYSLVFNKEAKGFHQWHIMEGFYDNKDELQRIFLNRIFFYKKYLDMEIFRRDGLLSYTGKLSFNRYFSFNKKSQSSGRESGDLPLNPSMIFDPRGNINHPFHLNINWQISKNFDYKKNLYMILITLEKTFYLGIQIKFYTNNYYFRSKINHIMSQHPKLDYCFDWNFPYIFNKLYYYLKRIFAILVLSKDYDCFGIDVTNTNIFCQIPFENITISYEGDVYPCINMFYKKEYLLGNIYRENINEILGSIKYLEFKRKIIQRTHSFCNNCNIGMAQNININIELLRNCGVYNLIN